jgi:hypothetical protein
VDRFSRPDNESRNSQLNQEIGDDEPAEGRLDPGPHLPEYKHSNHRSNEKAAPDGRMSTVFNSLAGPMNLN